MLQTRHVQAIYLGNLNVLSIELFGSSPHPTHVCTRVTLTTGDLHKVISTLWKYGSQLLDDCYTCMWLYMCQTISQVTPQADPIMMVFEVASWFIISRSDIDYSNNT